MDTVLASDDFNRSDGLLGINWSTVASDGNSIPAIISNRVTPGISGGGYNGNGGAGFNISWPNDQWSKGTLATIGGTNSLAGLCVRLDVGGGDTCYFLRVGMVSGAAYRDLTKRAASTYTTLGSDAILGVVGQIYKLSVVGSVITVSVNGVAVPALTATDSTITSGRAGVWTWTLATDQATSFDDWSGGYFASNLRPNVAIQQRIG